MKSSVLVLIVMLVLAACKKEKVDNPTNGKTAAVFNPMVNYGTMTDQDGNIYKTVTIGTQTWMAENLRTTIYNDGTTIPNVTGANEWGNLTAGAYCNYNNTINADTIATYGRLYNWYAINTGKIAPKGWHIPTNAEWTTLANYLGGEVVAGGKLKEPGTIHWVSPNTDANNETGFTALPGCSRFINGEFNNIGNYGDWWCATELDTYGAWFWHMGYNYSHLGKNGSTKKAGFSIRCVRD